MTLYVKKQEVCHNFLFLQKRIKIEKFRNTKKLKLFQVIIEKQNLLTRNSVAHFNDKDDHRRDKRVLTL